MKYALFVYGHESWGNHGSEAKRDIHQAHRALRDEHQAATSASASVIAHYRLRPPEKTITLSRAGDETVTTNGPGTEANRLLRAIYVLDSDEFDAVRDFAARLPALEMAGSVEIWPLIEPDLHGGRGHLGLDKAPAGGA